MRPVKTGLATDQVAAGVTAPGQAGQPMLLRGSVDGQLGGVAMLYREITQVSVVGLRGTMYLEKAREASGVSVETSGPYEAKRADESWLVVCPEGQELPSPVPAVRSAAAITAQGTHIGSADVTASVQFGGPWGARASAHSPAREKGTVRITAPPGTTVELVGCQGVRKGPGGWRFMKGTCCFAVH